MFARKFTKNLREPAYIESGACWIKRRLLQRSVSLAAVGKVAPYTRFPSKSRNSNHNTPSVHSQSEIINYCKVSEIREQQQQQQSKSGGVHSFVDSLESAVYSGVSPVANATLIYPHTPSPPAYSARKSILCSRSDGCVCSLFRALCFCF